MDKIGDFYLNSCYPNSESVLSVNFGNSQLDLNAAETIELPPANGFHKPRYRWYLQQKQKQTGRRGTHGESHLGFLNHVTIKDLHAPDTPDLPHSAIYEDMGWAMLRSSWDEDATMLAVKSGYFWNHTHADAGAFILFHNGKILISEAGRSSYNRPEYTTRGRHDGRARKARE